MAHSLRLGVETDSQREYMAGAGCHAYQGFFFSRPLADFEAFVRKALQAEVPVV